MEGDSQNFRPPVLVGERVAWMGSGSGLPQAATVRWIGRIPEITAGWTVGVELDNAMPVGGIDGTWRKRQLFSCEPKHGLLVPIDKIMKQSSLMRTRHSIGEKFYDEGRKPIRQQKQDLIRKLSLPQSANSQEFLCRVLPPGDKKPLNDPPEAGLSFKVAASQLLKPQLVKQTSLDTKAVPLTVANVRTLEKINEQPDIQTTRLQTFDELEKFKKHLDELVEFKNEFGTKGRKKKLGKNPESLYELARPVGESKESLFLRVIGEKKLESVQIPKRKQSEKFVVKNETTPELKLTHKPLLINNAENSVEPDFSAVGFETEQWETVIADELIETPFCNELALLSVVEIHEAETESLAQPAPTIRRKRQKELTAAPVPSPRRKSQDVRVLLEDTTSVLYEPAFLQAYGQGENNMSDVRGTFRRIDEDELDKRVPASHRLLTSSVSVPASSRKGLFSFLRWFKKKPKDDLDLDAFNAPSVTSSPLFTRNRLANAGSIDTLYSIATVSSFAFVSGAQYQSRFTSDKRKKRKAPQPPPPPHEVSLPSTLETRARQQHRRSVSESYKDKKSGAFAHVNGKRKAPQPPATQERLYPSLTNMQNGSLTGRKKRPAPLPPEEPDPEIATELVSVAEPAVEETVVCNDTLRLERGVLRPNKTTLTPAAVADVPKMTPTSPVSPRPWYKRKSLEKRKEKPVIDWLPEIGVPRSSADSPLKFHFFSRNEDKKKDEKRKSGISWLANISELDREAAEICRKEQVHQQELLDADDAKFYETEPEIPKRSSTRELISLFNAIGNVNASAVNPRVIENGLPGRESEQQEPTTTPVCDKPEIKTAAVVVTNDFVAEETNSRAQILFELRGRRHRSPSPTVSTIAEISEPSSSAATLNQYNEAIWVCCRCTLENFLWKTQCDACSASKPNSRRMNERRKSEMEFEIDWERELEKYFPDKKSPERKVVSGKLMVSKPGDVVIKTEHKEGDLDELRRKRLAFFIKSLGSDATTSLRDAAAKKSLDEAEKSKLKGMLKEMKDSLPKYEGVKNNLNAAGSKNESLPDVTGKKIDSEGKKYHESGKYGAIRRRPAEALLVTNTIVKEDILVVRKKPNGQLKKTRRVGDGPFELMRARDLANIIETGNVYPTHVYANCPPIKISDDGASESSVFDSDSNREMARLATQLTRAAGVAEFKATLDPSDGNTLAVNRLLRRLETAIAAGRHDQAATLARELAGLKVNCSVTRQRPSPSPSPTFITAEMYVEDKLTHQGPIPIKVQKTMTLSDLKIKVQTDFQIPGHVQRWILGKQLATEEYKTLEDFGVIMDNCPLFLYLVAPEPEAIPTVPAEEPVKVQNNDDEDDGARAQTPRQLGKGWYYNYEEDRYSFCNSDSQSDEEEPKAAAVKIIQRTIEKQKSKSPPDLTGGDMVLQPPQQSKPFSPKHQRPPLRTSLSEPGKDEAEIVNESKPDKVTGARPRSRSIFDLIKPQANDTLKKDLKVISVNAVKETIEKLTRRGEDLQKNGWKCGACTLLNATNRMICSVCFAPRPAGYSDPVKSPIEEELRKLRRDQALDLFIDEAAKPTEGKQHYLQLVNLDGDDVVSNTEPFDCPICLVNYLAGEGVVLKECLHAFCRDCLLQTVQTSEEAEVKCPFMDYNYSCECVLQQREIKALVPKEIFEKYLARSVAQAENRMGNAFHCKTPDCKGWCVLEDNVNEFPCPVCKHVNCLTCQAIHEEINCKTHQDRLNSSGESNTETKRTKSMLEEMVQKGDAMACPTCQVVLMKKWGCDWLRCSMCKTEICWVTRGPRWGSAGKGDTSAGCKCGVNGVKCHPKCNYCH